MLANAAPVLADEDRNCLNAREYGRCVRYAVVRYMRAVGDLYRSGITRVSPAANSSWKAASTAAMYSSGVISPTQTFSISS